MLDHAPDILACVNKASVGENTHMLRLPAQTKAHYIAWFSLLDRQKPRLYRHFLQPVALWQSRIVAKIKGRESKRLPDPDNKAHTVKTNMRLSSLMVKWGSKCLPCAFNDVDT